ncbi:MAG: ABC transporter substrate-binding protein [Acidimicrobiales bacterium]
MSKLLALLLALAFMAAACGSDDADSEASGDDGSSESSSEDADDSTDQDADQGADQDGGEGASGDAVTITIESWRSDDLAIWNDEIIPAFEAANPEIKVEFSPTPPADYNAALATRLEGGTAGDLITCRPCDASLALFDDGHLAPLNDLDGIGNFSSVAQSAWITDDGATPFCVPMASVIHGFIYNQTAFDELGLTVPETEDEFLAVLQAIADDGSYTPLGLGTSDQWEAATVGFQNIGPNYWNGEDGRNALISGDAKLTDSAYVETFEALAKWSDYLPNGASGVVYTDAQNLFTLGQAAIYPSGSWEISGFNENADFEFGAFKPPLPDGQSTCYISDHTDIAVGLNAASPNADAAKTFLSWVASSDFAGIYANALPGFFSLQDTPVTLTDPVAQEFVSWRDECESTIRNSYQILSRGEPNLEDELWATSAGVLNGDLSPEDAAQRLQDGLDTWYTPAG